MVTAIKTAMELSHRRHENGRFAKAALSKNSSTSCGPSSASAGIGTRRVLIWSQFEHREWTRKTLSPHMGNSLCSHFVLINIPEKKPRVESVSSQDGKPPLRQSSQQICG